MERHRAEISERCVRSLERMGSPLAWDSVMLEQLRAQVGRVLDDTVATMRGGPLADALETPDTASVEIGAHRARHGIHLIESLRAASVLFETALSRIGGELREADSVVRFGLALQECISRRMIVVSRAYFAAWVDEVHNVQAEQRLRVLRELTEVSRGQLVGAIHTMLDGGQQPVAAVGEGWGDAREPGGPDGPLLSRREREVLQLAGRGLSNRQVAGALHVTEGTVRSHLGKAYKKLGATRRLDAVNRAVAAGLIRPAVGYAHDPAAPAPPHPGRHGTTGQRDGHGHDES